MIRHELYIMDVESATDIGHIRHTHLVKQVQKLDENVELVEILVEVGVPHQLTEHNKTIFGEVFKSWHTSTSILNSKCNQHEDKESTWEMDNKHN